MKQLTRLLAVAVLAGGLFAIGGITQGASAACSATAVVVIPSLHPQRPGGNANVCVREGGQWVEVGVVPVADIGSLFFGTYTQVACVYSANICLLTSGRTGLEVDPPTKLVDGGTTSTGPACVGSPQMCPWVEVSGKGGLVAVYYRGVLVHAVPLGLVCAHWNSSCND